MIGLFFQSAVCKYGGLQTGQTAIRKNPPIGSGCLDLTNSLLGKPGFILRFINENDRLGRTIPFTGAALDTNIDVDVRLCLSVRDGIALTSNHTGTTQGAFIRNNIRHGFAPNTTDKKGLDQLPA
jgi:hypothetical protein